MSNNNDSNTSFDIADQNSVYQSPTPKFEMNIEIYNSTTVIISWPSMDSRFDNRDVSKFSLDINYTLVYAELFSGSQYCSATLGLSHHQEDHNIFLNQCKQSVSYFTQSDDIEDSDQESLTHYCDVERLRLNVSSSELMFIGDLLPGQPYSVTATLHGPRKGVHQDQQNDTEVLSGPLYHSICMLDDVPRFVPQTDLGSFVILNRDKKAHQSEIELYWRPVPKVLQSGSDFRHRLTCLNESGYEVFEPRVFDQRTGRANLTKPSNESYTCQLRSMNRLGISKDYSRIILPKVGQLINLQAHPKFYVATLSPNEYILKWSPQLKHENDTESREDYQYTIYWCNPGNVLSGCSDIEGMLRTRKNIYYLKMPSIVHQPRNFGLSFRSPKFYSGIIWSDCIATSQEHTMYEPLKIVEAIGVEGNHTALKISWMFRGCNSMTALVSSFELALCDLGQVNPCLIPVPNSIPNDDTQKYDYTNCPIIKVSNKLNNEAILNKLGPSTKYLVRVRYSLQNQTYNPWSEGVIAHTYADPFDTRSCWQRSILFNVSIIVATIILLSLIYCSTYRYVGHYLEVINRYRQSHKELPERLKCKVLDENGFDGAASRFAANKCAAPIPGLIVDSAGDTDRLSKRSVRNNHQSEHYVRYQASILDYIPCQLLVDDRNEQTNSDSNQGSPNDDIQCALTAADEISLTSQSSFLETILDRNVGDPNSH